MYPQVDTQLIFLHFLCGLMFFYFAVKVFIKKMKLEILNHPLIFSFFFGIN